MELSEREKDIIKAIRVMDEELQEAAWEMIRNAAYGWVRYGQDLKIAEGMVDLF